jgi:GTP-binding protein Era
VIPGVEEGFRSGFAALVGRPNVGKSTLLNALVGDKVAIVSDRPQTTRAQIRGVRTTATHQTVFIDTPGVHRARTALGERTNQRAYEAVAGCDVICVVLESNRPIGPGDRYIAGRAVAAGVPRLCVLTKTDLATPTAIAEHLALAGSGELGEFDAFVPISAPNDDGVAALAGEIERRLPLGPQLYPDGVITDQPEAFLVAELLREQLIAAARDELPHSITVSVDEIEERTTNDGTPLLAMRAIVRVERESQKGIVIGKGGEHLKAAGTAVRLALEARLGVRVHLETHVRVEADWQRRPGSLDRLGF